MNLDENRKIRALADLDQIRAWIIDVRSLLEFIEFNTFSSGVAEVDLLVHSKIKELLKAVGK